MRKASLALASGLAVLLAGTGTAAGKTLRASHQWPGGQGDVRDKMVRILAKQVEQADVDLNIKVYPGSSLFKPKEQWSAMARGRLDISAFPLDYASGRHPAFSATLMPGLVRNHQRAKRLNDSKFMDMIKKEIRDGGVRVLSDAWLAGGFVSQQQCIAGPDSVKSQTMRAAGPAFEEMLAQAGASITSMPSSDIYQAMQTGVLDGANTSSGSLVSYRIYEQSKCLTPPGENALWFMYEPILISSQTWEGLNDEQRKALTKAGEAAEEYFAKKAANLDEKLVEVYRENDVKINKMTKEQYQAWLDVARESAYKNFTEDVENGQELIDAALAVD